MKGLGIAAIRGVTLLEGGACEARESAGPTRPTRIGCLTQPFCGMLRLEECET